jgi:hypothetical protein
MSCSNVVAALKVINGAEPGKTEFVRPSDPAAFEQPWSVSVGVTAFNVDHVIRPEDIEFYSNEEILRQIEQQPGEDEQPDSETK